MRLCPYFIVVCAALAVAESCWNLNPLRSDFSRKCHRWRRKAGRYASYRNRAIKRCVVLVQNNCPGTVIMATDNVDKRVYNHYTTWKIQTTATFTPTMTSVKFVKKQKRDICADDDGDPGNCDFWWKAAIWKGLENSMVDRCVSQVLYNCPDMLTVIRDNISQKKNMGEDVDVQELTYKHKTTGQEVTFRKYHFYIV